MPSFAANTQPDFHIFLSSRCKYALSFAPLRLWNLFLPLRAERSKAIVQK
jgi:hypothetical protein